MKTIKITTIILLSITIFLSCNKDKDEGAFVDDYKPDLTEEEGTEYTGNYFPMDIGYWWLWSGSASSTGQIKAAGQSIPFDHDNMPVHGNMSVVSEIEIELNSETYTVFVTSETDGMSRYFEKQNNAVYIRAFRIANSEDIIEVENPVYLKNPLLVGDSWETHPQVDYNTVLAENTELTNPELDIDIKCMFFVVGQENMSWDGDNVETLRLDQRAEVTGTMTSQEGNMEFIIKMTVYLNLLEDVGLIYQAHDIDMSVWGSMESQVIEVSYSMNMETEGDITLDDYSLESGLKNNINKRLPKEKLKLNDELSQQQLDQLMEILRLVKATIF